MSPEQFDDWFEDYSFGYRGAPGSSVADFLMVIDGVLLDFEGSPRFADELEAAARPFEDHKNVHSELVDGVRPFEQQLVGFQIHKTVVVEQATNQQHSVSHLSRLLLSAALRCDTPKIPPGYQTASVTKPFLAQTAGSA